MKRIRFDLTWWRSLAVSVLACVLVGSNAMSIGIRTQSGPNSNVTR